MKLYLTSCSDVQEWFASERAARARFSELEREYPDEFVSLNAYTAGLSGKALALALLNTNGWAANIKELAVRDAPPYEGEA